MSEQALRERLKKLKKRSTELYVQRTKTDDQIKEVENQLAKEMYGDSAYVDRDILAHELDETYVIFYKDGKRQSALWKE